MLAGEEAHARARALLLQHLSPDQRREYEEIGSFSVVKSGAVWAWCVWKVLLVHASLLVLLAVPAFQLGGLSSAAAVFAMTSVLLLRKWLRSLRVALSLRRTYRIAPLGPPTLEVRAQRVEFCVGMDAALPGADQMLAYKNILEANEAYFLRQANARL